MSEPSAIKLSICITTFNRAAFIGMTLDSILPQLTNDCEVVVLDGASTDHTGHVVSDYECRFKHLRYFKQVNNNGLDRDYDRTVELARGEYCWLMTDDDVLKQGAVASVLRALHRNLSLIVVNAEIRDFTLSKVLQARCLDFDDDRVYGPEEMDRLFAEIGFLNIHFFVIKREIWLAREKKQYYGSLYLYMGVIFQAYLPGESLVIAEPLLSYRMGNTHTYSLQVRESIWDTWPSLAESLAISESTRRIVHSMQPWKYVEELLLWRGRGYYSLSDYNRWIRPRVGSIYEAFAPILIALLPGALINVLLISYYSLTRRRYGLWHAEPLLQELRASRYHFRNWQLFERAPRFDSRR